MKGAKNGHLHIVKYLAEQGQDIHKDDEAVLRYSAKNGHLDVVKYCVEEHQADIHAGEGFALRHSAASGHLEVVKYLVENGADIHAVDDFALKLSAASGHLEVVKYLVEKGADIHALIRNGGNEYDYDLDIVKYLLSVGVPINFFGEYFFNKCVEQDQPEVAEFMVQFLPETVSEDLVSTEFHNYALKYGIIYKGSNYLPMEEEYKKRTDVRAKIKNELYQKAQEILYRPGGIRAQLLEERFQDNLTKYNEMLWKT